MLSGPARTRRRRAYRKRRVLSGFGGCRLSLKETLQDFSSRISPLWPLLFPVMMARPKNLRRDASDEEDDKDVFDDDDISEESQSSDDDVPRPLKGRESEGVQYTKADQGRGDGLSCSATPSPGGRTAEKSGDDGEDGRTTEGEVGDSSHFEEESAPPKGLENGLREYDHAGCEPRFQPEAEGYGNSEANQDAYSGAPQRGKPTWQLMKEDPSFVPRGSSYFLHDDRGGTSQNEDESEEEQREGRTRAFADDGSDSDGRVVDDEIPRSTQTRIGPSRKLWTVDETRDAAGGGGKWVHDRFESLLEEEASQRHSRSRGVFSRNRGGKGVTASGQRPGGRGGFRGPPRERGRGRRGRGRKREEGDWVAYAGNSEQGNSRTGTRTAATSIDGRPEAHSGTPLKRGQGSVSKSDLHAGDRSQAGNDGGVTLAYVVKGTTEYQPASEKQVVVPSQAADPRRRPASRRGRRGGRGRGGGIVRTSWAIRERVPAASQEACSST